MVRLPHSPSCLSTCPTPIPAPRSTFSRDRDCVPTSKSVLLFYVAQFNSPNGCASAATWVTITLIATMPLATLACSSLSHLRLLCQPALYRTGCRKEPCQWRTEPTTIEVTCPPCKLLYHNKISHPMRAIASSSPMLFLFVFITSHKLAKLTTQMTKL
jgi:hypothetical protein